MLLGNETAKSLHTSRQQAGGRYWALCALAAICMLAETLPSSAIAQSAYPDRPIRLIVAFAPGGMTDIIARLLGERLSDNLGQSVYIDNKGGATGELGAKLVSSAEPDGYTLLVTTTTVAIGAAANPSDVNPVSQLSPIAAVASAPTLFVVKAPTAAKGLKQFVLAHDERQPLTYSSAGTGTPEHLTAAYVLKGIPGGDAVHIPYRSGGEATNAVLGGHVDIAATVSPTALALIQERKVKPLAVASHKRLAMFPDVPTLAESGLIDVENASWIAIFGPPNLPQPVVQTLSAAVSAALHESNFHKRLTEMGFDIQEMTQAETVQFTRNEIKKWGEILKATGVTLE